MKVVSLIIILISFTSNLFGTIQKKPAVKPIVAPQKKKCCSIDKTFNNKVNLNQICSESGKTTIELEISEYYSICSKSENIGLTDETGKSYKVFDVKNISSCPEILKANPGHKIYWIFESISKGISTLHLTGNKPNDPPPFPNWEYWHWDAIDISHCKF